MPNEIIQGDAGTVISLTIRDDSQIVDLTGATVEVAIKFKATGIVKQATVTSALKGECQFTLEATDIPHQGVYSFQATVKFTDGKQFSSQIERFTVGKKMNYVPNVGGGNSDIGESTTNGNIIVNGMDIKVYDDTTIKSDINSLKNFKHTHGNLEDLERLGVNEYNKLTLDGVELATGGNGTIGVDGKSAYQIWLDQGNAGTVSTFLNSLKGAKGDKGDKGDTGATGQNGLNGKSAYQIWLDAGNTGTESTFLLSLKGEKGDSGTGGGTIPSNVIYFEDWVGGESVTIDTGGTTPPVDTTAPSNVTNLTTSNVVATSLTLSWTASNSTDVSGYEVYRGSTLLATVTGTTYNVTGLTEKTQYTFTIKAKDTTGNIASGSSVTVTTSDVTAPNNVTNLTTSNVTATSVTLSWTASTSTDVSGYEIYNGASLLGTVSGVSYPVSGLTANTAYTFTVKAKDAANNVSTGTSVNVTTSSVADTTAPNPVTNLTSGTVTSNSIPVSWTLSSSSDVANYEVAYSTNGTNFTVSSSVVNASSTTYTVTGLVASTNYTIRVVAIDGAGNRSSAVTVSVSTSAPADTTAPILTITPAATFADSQTVSMSTNEAADIWYTTDGSDPVSSGTRVKYSVALTLTATTTVKAYAVDTAGNASATQTGIYTKETPTSGGETPISDMLTASFDALNPTLNAERTIWTDDSGNGNDMTLVPLSGRNYIDASVWGANGFNVSPQSGYVGEITLPYTSFNSYPLAFEFVAKLPFGVANELIRIGSDSSTGNHIRLWHSTSGKILMYMYNSATNPTTQPYGEYLYPSELRDKFMHIVVNVTQTNIEIYINGVNGTTKVGTASYNFPSFGSGVNDKVRIYNSTRNGQTSKIIRVYKKNLINSEVQNNYTFYSSLLG